MQINEIRTERLTIRGFKGDDWGDLYEYLSDEEVLRFEPYKPFTGEKARQEAERRESDQRFLAVCLEDGKVIGNLYFAAGEFDTWELGYVFNRDYWGHGYALESARGVMKYAFETLGVRRIVGMCDPSNPGSWKLLEKLGMRREAFRLKNVYFFKDENDQPLWKDTYEYAILKSEYEGH